MSGESVTLSEQRGRWVLLNFWATWCPPCVQEMPYLNPVSYTHLDVYKRQVPRVVTALPLDGTSVAVTSGLQPGDRVATPGATLINQVR